MRDRRYINAHLYMGNDITQILREQIIMNFSKTLDNTINEFAYMLNQVDEKSVERLVDEILSSDRIFIAGMGRSRLVAHPFAMRLMHMGLKAYIVGDTTTPAIGECDLLIVISGSGKTEITHHIAATAQKIGARIFLLTAQPRSKIGDTSDFVLVIPAAERPELPLGSGFEGAVYILFDVLVMLLMQKLGIGQEKMMERHSNLE